MTRLVRLIRTRPGQPVDTIARPFSNFSDRPNLVLLGEPGAGKTHLFKDEAAATGARFVRARDFFNIPATYLRECDLFIDGLDEKRSGRGDRDTIDLLVARLFEIDPPKFRISCRAAEWLGESDLAALAPYFEMHGGSCVLHLENLSRVEQANVLMARNVTESEVNSFLDTAADRGVSEFLNNPQNLIMLWSAVQGGTWPATRTELYKISTGLMLAEANTERARSGTGTFTSLELRPAAGAVCAARLISDVGAIGLSDQEGTADCPSYRSLNLCSREEIQAALGRRVFDALPEIEAADYAHRTTAEFLAAEFLAARIREGLPFGRVQALIGIDGHPASELRGLHAWLAVHLPEHADALIDADAYGVLAYGDAAALTIASCVALLKALVRLSQTNPWFRSSNGQVAAVGALARPDMIDALRAILDDPAAGFGVRLIVLDALALGTPLFEMVPDLRAVLARPASVYTERRHALDALLRFEDRGKDAIRAAFVAGLGGSAEDLRLRTAVVQELYGDPYGPAEVIALIQASMTINSSLLSGIFWILADTLPIADIPIILDGITVPATDTDDFEVKSREASSFYARLIVRAWPISNDVEPARIMSWLHKRSQFRGLIGSRRASDLRAAMAVTPERLKALATYFFAHVPADKDRWLALSRFREVTLSQLKADDLAPIAFEALTHEEAGSDRHLFLYEVALRLSISTEIFDIVFAYADEKLALKSTRESSLITQLPDNYFTGRSNNNSDIDYRSKQLQDFDLNIYRIRRGLNLEWLAHLARLYFGLYSDVDRHRTPRERISDWLGTERIEAAIDGLTASLFRQDLPDFDFMLASISAQRSYDWWYALLAGVNERWWAGSGLEALSDELIKTILAFSITHPVWTLEDNAEHRVVHPWRKALMVQRPELARDVYLAVARVQLSRLELAADGLHELLTDPALASFRPDVVLELLRDFPTAEPVRLAYMFDAALMFQSIHRELLALAETVLTGQVSVGTRQHDLWLATAYALAYARFEHSVRQRAAACPDFIFDLRDRCGFGTEDGPDQTPPLPMLEFLAQLTGTLYPDAPFPTDGWSGDRNPWDASDYFRRLMNAMSASSNAAATKALERLAADPQLGSYRPKILAALDHQRQRWRDTEYDRPDWTRTIAALGNRAPATVADLHALLVAQLHDLAHLIAKSNTDIFKQFWNIDQYAKITVPRPEEACRDSVITLLRPILLPLGIILEPEGHMAADKRADISASMPGRKILCELKRDYHAAVWTAMSSQLERFYAHDPEAGGFGIYLVFWFGSKRPRLLPKPPTGTAFPKNATEMGEILRSLLPISLRNRLEIIVFDVTGDL